MRHQILGILMTHDEIRGRPVLDLVGDGPMDVPKGVEIPALRPRLTFSSSCRLEADPVGGLATT